MAQAYPYTFVACPCTDTSKSQSATAWRDFSEEADDTEEEKTFNPHSPRANYSLYPIEHLLYCTDCHQLRCPKCVNEEIVDHYCPSCLFEVPGSILQSEGSRCTRNCYGCPVCTSPLSVSALEAETASLDPHSYGQPTGPYFLSCAYCNWSTLDIDITFDKPNKIYQQLQHLRNGGTKILTPKEVLQEREVYRLTFKEVPEPFQYSSFASADEAPLEDDHFTNLQWFYRTQLSEASGQTKSFGDSLSYTNSPASLTRIMALYGGLNSAQAAKRAKEKPAPMREALAFDEGLNIFDPSHETRTIKQMASTGWQGSTTASQRFAQPVSSQSRFASSLRPIATLLRTRKNKRCKACRHILVKPESKLTSTRYKIRLLALNYIPTIKIRALPAPSPASIATTLPTQQSFDYDRLAPGKAVQYLLTLQNPLFNTVRVTLATPAVTPGSVQSRVTILCPQFEVGAHTDVWDEALGPTATSGRDRRGLGGSGSGSGSGESGPVAEAGKVWEKGRDWTSVIVEVVPGFRESAITAGAREKKAQGQEIAGEDEDVLEIPVFVRIEYEVDPTTEEGSRTTRGGSSKEKETRELAYWVVLGVGKIELGK